MGVVTLSPPLYISWSALSSNAKNEPSLPPHSDVVNPLPTRSAAIMSRDLFGARVVAQAAGDGELRAAAVEQAEVDVDPGVLPHV